MTVLYGPAKVGKSTFCASAPDALFIATEPGLNHLDVYRVDVTSWLEVQDVAALLQQEIRAGRCRFQTVIIDTADLAYVRCQEHVLGQQKVLHESDLGFGKGWSLVQNEFRRTITQISQLGLGVILVSHADEKNVEDFRGNRRTKIVPTLPKGARDVVLAMADVILFCDIIQRDDGSWRRVVHTKPHKDFEAGDRTGRLPPIMDLDYASVIAAMGRTSPAAARPREPLAVAPNPPETEAQPREVVAPSIDRLRAGLESHLATPPAQDAPPASKKPFGGPLAEEILAVKDEIVELLGPKRAEAEWKLKVPKVSGATEEARRPVLEAARLLLAKAKADAEAEESCK
ncbi:MAG TPA: ATP-binding protein [Rhodothermales bacterium]|nr:ATP-binding protein [Rhodothermales bacterium]